MGEACAGKVVAGKEVKFGVKLNWKKLSIVLDPTSKISDTEELSWENLSRNKF